LFVCFDTEGETFFSQTFTGDETWVHHFELGGGKQSVEWHQSQSPWKKNIKKVSISGQDHRHSDLEL
jgi:hypothetical protein